jgi:hypothetical protein
MRGKVTFFVPKTQACTTACIKIVDIWPKDPIAARGRPLPTSKQSEGVPLYGWMPLVRKIINSAKLTCHKGIRPFCAPFSSVSSICVDPAQIITGKPGKSPIQEQVFYIKGVFSFLAAFPNRAAARQGFAYCNKPQVSIVAMADRVNSFSRCLAMVA